MTADDKYSLLNKDNLTELIHTQLSHKPKNFCQFGFVFPKSTLHFQHFQKRDDPHCWYVSEITDSEKCG